MADIDLAGMLSTLDWGSSEDEEDEDALNIGGLLSTLSSSPPPAACGSIDFSALVGGLMSDAAAATLLQASFRSSIAQRLEAQRSTVRAVLSRMQELRILHEFRKTAKKKGAEANEAIVLPARGEIERSTQRALLAVFAARAPLTLLRAVAKCVVIKASARRAAAQNGRSASFVLAGRRASFARAEFGASATQWQVKPRGAGSDAVVFSRAQRGEDGVSIYETTVRPIDLFCGATVRREFQHTTSPVSEAGGGAAATFWCVGDVVDHIAEESDGGGDGDGDDDDGRFLITYDDGDAEELTRKELEPILIESSADAWVQISQGVYSKKGTKRSDAEEGEPAAPPTTTSDLVEIFGSMALHAPLGFARQELEPDGDKVHNVVQLMCEAAIESPALWKLFVEHEQNSSAECK